MDQVNILLLPSKPFGGGGGNVNLVLSWNFSANQNQAFYMQRLIQAFYMQGGGEGVNLILSNFLSRLV